MDFSSGAQKDNFLMESAAPSPSSAFAPAGHSPWAQLLVPARPGLAAVLEHELVLQNCSQVLLFYGGKEQELHTEFIFSYIFAFF